MKLFSVFFFTFFVFSGAVFSQEADEKHPIDIALDKCMDKNPSTQGTVGCLDEAYKKWDAELNKNYKALTLKMDAKQKAALLAAQRKWIEYRDLEFKAQLSVYETMQGTMFQPMIVNDRMEVVKKRALDLKSYLDLFEIK
ncbi:MAG: lysozyme inhibitor LprI family protein [Spirosomataceae bacterium]